MRKAKLDLAIIAPLVVSALLVTSAVMATESEDSSATKAKSADTKIEVRSVTKTDHSAASSDGDAKEVTVVLNVSGDVPDTVMKAIEQLEKQLKASKLPEAMQKKVLESLRTQIDEDADRKSTFNKRVEIQLPFRFPDDLSGPMERSYQMASGVDPAQKKKLREAIGKALKESGVAEETVDSALDKVDKAIDSFAARPGYAWTSFQQPPYRIGIAFKSKESDDTTDGAEVDRVFEDSPADKAGLEPGDYLIRVDDEPIKDHQQIIDYVQKAGEEKRSLRLEVKRGDETKIYEVTPTQTAIAELNLDTMPKLTAPLAPSFPVPGTLGPAWVIPQWPKGGPTDPKFQEQIREAVKDAISAARGAVEDGRCHGSNDRSESASSSNQELKLDELKKELSNVREELDEIKALLLKLSSRRAAKAGSE